MQGRGAGWGGWVGCWLQAAEVNDALQQLVVRSCKAGGGGKGTVAGVGC